MKRGLTYRSIILALGIGVALIVVLTFWASRKHSPVAITKPVASIIPQASDVSFLKDLLKKSEVIY
ncbi:hypothetical protein WBG78_05220 [Chryseolinea sp. T2]|uniref:hypothetical protein n=1 Tax=Chryseolinea sp. T2 TaxID=3129255 RepID=UPI00307744F6